MSKNKFQKLSENIVNYIGSKDNVTYFVHCVTRLRFNLKDKSLSKPEEIEKLPGKEKVNDERSIFRNCGYYFRFADTFYPGFDRCRYDQGAMSVTIDLWYT